MTFEKPKFSNGLILLVDDNVSQRDVLQAAINTAGFICQVAANTANALNMLEEAEFKLAIVAQKMRPVNGLECATYIRDLKTQDQLPILMIAESLHSDDEKDALLAGIDRIIVRETNRNPIIGTIHELLKIPV